MVRHCRLRNFIPDGRVGELQVDSRRHVVTQTVEIVAGDKVGFASSAGIVGGNSAEASLISLIDDHNQVAIVHRQLCLFGE